MVIKNIFKNIIKNNEGVANLELIFALTLFIGASMMAFHTLPTMSHDSRDWRIQQYMTTTRVTDNLIQDSGDQKWWIYWQNGNYSNVSKIGLDDNENNTFKILDQEKIVAMMGNGYIDNSTGMMWWEFPNSTVWKLNIDKTKIDNMSRILGLNNGNFYIQLYPIDKNFNYGSIKQNLSNVPINAGTSISIDRYVFIKDTSAKYLTYNNDVIHYRLNLWVW